MAWSLTVSGMSGASGVPAAGVMVSAFAFERFVILAMNSVDLAKPHRHGRWSLVISVQRRKRIGAFGLNGRTAFARPPVVQVARPGNGERLESLLFHQPILQMLLATLQVMNLHAMAERPNTRLAKTSQCSATFASLRTASLVSGLIGSSLKPVMVFAPESERLLGSTTIAELGALGASKKRKVVPSASAMVLRLVHSHTGPIGTDVKRDQVSKLGFVKLPCLLDLWGLLV